MSPKAYYRYFSHPAELEQFYRRRVIQSTNPVAGGKTWFTPDRYEDPDRVQELLALKTRPRHRFGPLAEVQMPELDVCTLRRVDPAYGRGGGGYEVCTSKQTRVFGCYSFDGEYWEF
jgi:hypothetical protein